MQKRLNLVIVTQSILGFLSELRINLVALYNSVMSSKLIAVKVLFKPLWDASECVMSPNNLLLKIQHPLEDSLYGIHLLKQALFTEDMFPWTSLALLVHEEARHSLYYRSSRAISH